MGTVTELTPSGKQWLIGTSLRLIGVVGRTIRATFGSKEKQLPIFRSLSKVENHRRGYPRYAAFINADPTFAIFRRFGTLRARSLLHKQAELCDLEAKLATIDMAETRQVYLSSWRLDGNEQRKDLVRSIDEKLAEYDLLLMNFRAVLELPSATEWNLKSVLNWLGGTKPLVAAESEHLNDPADLVALSSTADSGVLDWLVESGLYKAGYGKLIENPRRHLITDDENIMLFSNSRIETLARCLTAFLATIILSLPVVLLYFFNQPLVKLLIILVSTFIFSLAIAVLTRARKAEVFAATAAYGAVLVVFVSTVNSH
ncbi:hypothetical protein BDD12DRAFT_234760 [Trichophaea hybrida]|nr:hypothetical protein BDD12DRAFT_234760 [Trichophaea hybrida]